MGYYHCPRCGGNESYVGNTLVNRKGVTLTQEIGDSGVYGSASSGGTEAIQVRKCRGCGEILTSANFVPSQDEVAAADREREKEQRRFPVSAFVVSAGCIVVFLWGMSWYNSLPSYDKEGLWALAAVGFLLPVWPFLASAKIIVDWSNRRRG